jgi:hypothetical protein
MENSIPTRHGSKDLFLHWNAIRLWIIWEEKSYCDLQLGWSEFIKVVSRGLDVSACEETIWNINFKCIVCACIWYLNACALLHAALWERRRRVSLCRMINAAKTSGTQSEGDAENDNNNHPRQKKNDKFHIILCFAASLSKLIIAREWERELGKNLIIFLKE